jgi:hypothetical protein
MLLAPKTRQFRCTGNISAGYEFCKIAETGIIVMLTNKNMGN